MVDVWTTINNRQYVARLRPHQPATLILRGEQPVGIDKTHYLLRTIFNFDCLIPITPQNVHNKIETILVFSWTLNVDFVMVPKKTSDLKQTIV